MPNEVELLPMRRTDEPAVVVPAPDPVVDEDVVVPAPNPIIDEDPVVPDLTPAGASAVDPSILSAANAVLCQLNGSLTWMRRDDLDARLADDGCTVEGDEICWSAAYSDLPDPKPELTAASPELLEWVAGKGFSRQWYVIDTELRDSISLCLIQRNDAALYIARSGGESSYRWVSQSSFDSIMREGGRCPVSRGAILYSIKFAEVDETLHPAKADGSIETENGKLAIWFEANREALLASSATHAVEIAQRAVSAATMLALSNALRVYAKEYDRVYDADLRLVVEDDMSDHLVVGKERLKRGMDALVALRSRLQASGSKRLLKVLNDLFAGLPLSVVSVEQREPLTPRGPSLTGFFAGFAGRKGDVREIIAAVDLLRIACGLKQQQARCNYVLATVDDVVSIRAMHHPRA